MIGNGRTAALVGIDGAVDWWCRPRFDSPAVLCRILDSGHGGTFRVGPQGRFSATRRYLGATGIIETIFESAGRARLTDFMTGDEHGSPALLRLLEGLAGELDMQITFRPTFDFARASTAVSPAAGGAVAAGDGHELALAAPLDWRPDGSGGIHARFRLQAQDRMWLVAGDPEQGRPPARLAASADDLLRRAGAQQQSWAARLRYDGPYRAEVERSALTMLLLTHAATGAPVAAPTTSLPEHIGGVRNWDYRYTWLRDSALGLRALQRLGYHEEPMTFWSWLARRAQDSNARLRIAYRVDGDDDLREEELAHLAGYRGSVPVRLGNAATDQIQLDVAGEVLDAAWFCRQHMPEVAHPYDAFTDIADRVAASWRLPDQGLWEVRSAPEHFVHSKVWSWVALERAVRLAQSGVLSRDSRRWESQRDAVARAVLDEGIDSSTGAFMRSFGSAEVDAAVLTIPMAGFLPPTDPRVKATVELVRSRLQDNGLVRRYIGDDGLPGREGAFLPCSFWLSEALAMAGRTQEAHEVFERAASCANDLGLLAEEADPVTSEPLGNFPQAFSHLGLISAALRLQVSKPGTVR